MCSCSGACLPACLQVARVCSACCTQPRTRTCEGSAFSTTSYKLLRLLLLTSPYRGVCCCGQGPVRGPSPVQPHLHVCYRPTASRFSRAMQESLTTWTVDNVFALTSPSSGTWWHSISNLSPTTLSSNAALGQYLVLSVLINKIKAKMFCKTSVFSLCKHSYHAKN